MIVRRGRCDNLHISAQVSQIFLKATIIFGDRRQLKYLHNKRGLRGHLLGQIFKLMMTMSLKIPSQTSNVPLVFGHPKGESGGDIQSPSSVATVGVRLQSSLPPLANCANQNCHPIAVVQWQSSVDAMGSFLGERS